MNSDDEILLQNVDLGDTFYIQESESVKILEIYRDTRDSIREYDDYEPDNKFCNLKLARIGTTHANSIFVFCIQPINDGEPHYNSDHKFFFCTFYFNIELNVRNKFKR